MKRDRQWYEEVARKARAVLYSAVGEPDTQIVALRYALLAMRKLEPHFDLWKSVSETWDKCIVKYVHSEAEI